MENKYEILTPDCTYHMYNRANGSEKLFLTDENYRYFLHKYREYISPVADTFCYCLMPNHFHFLIRVKPESEVRSFFTASRGAKDDQGFKNLDRLRATASIEDQLSKQFSNFFNAYAKAFNKQHNRMGSLFMHTFKRKRINDENYLRNLVRYIHHNPIESKMTGRLDKWRYSSYHTLLSDESTFLCREELMEYFDDKVNFIYFHTQESGQLIEYWAE